MKNWVFLIFVSLHIGFLLAQNTADSLTNSQNNINADDPSQFLTRIEVFNEIQYHKKGDFYLNQTVIRGVVKIGKRFTSRIDIPLVYNSLTNRNNANKVGLGDISFRLLGYKITETPKTALTTSIEVSLNTAQSPNLGKGKILLVPMITYTRAVPKQKTLLAITFQQTNSLNGDKTRNDFSFSKVQLFIIKKWSKKAWTVLQPEWYIDYVNGGVSMNLRSRITYAPIRRMNIYATPSVGVFGDFITRYQWSGDIGVRYYMFRK